MGQELSCTSRGKPLAEQFEHGLGQVVAAGEAAADYVEQALDDATSCPPATATCELSDKEQIAAVGIFWQLVREQGNGVTGSSAVIYEDMAMALCLQRLGVLSSIDALGSERERERSSSAATGLHEVASEPPVELMLQRLHALPVGQWLVSDPTRRCYKVDEWVSLLSKLQCPALLVETATVPVDYPLPVSAVLQIPSKAVLVCGCANDSPLDRVEHMLDAATGTPRPTHPSPDAHPSPGP